MGKSELTPEEQFLKDGDRSMDVRPVDIHDPVMEAIGFGKIRCTPELETPLPGGEAIDTMRRVETETRSARDRKRILRMPVRSWAAALILIVLLGGGYSWYTGGPRQAAGFEYEVLPYKPLPVTKSGLMISLLKAPLTPGLPPDPAASQPQPRKQREEDELWTLKYNKGYNAIKKLLLPGEYATFVLKQDGREGRSQLGVYHPLMKFTDYSAFKSSAEKHLAPHLKQPGYMPDGYKFDQAWIPPSIKKIEEKELLAGTGGIKLGDGFRVIWRREPAGNIAFNSSSLMYRNGENQINLNAKRIDEKAETAETLLWTKTTTIENIDIGGKQLIYLEPSGNEDFKVGYKYKLVWADPEAQIVYDVTANAENTTLTKDEIIRIAAGMMN
ncbi:DUF4367 domain-containing protein [Paenibacillus tritici]|uniref:DUF4367 domain-containing protein n=1 Tax=Paenibacillus tritici TaxID=1873425 RepID=A0ABX2DLL0_9BACL|nr:DUF4367 domain-containing protein [Paenibacillus tritici]NQX45519.1 DUF4367 domain-containing protein [Paenibacillus tritici]